MGQTYIEDSNQVFDGASWTGDEYARRIHEDGRLVHTFRTASVYVFGDHNTFRNCTFRNTAGKGKDVGQAIALYVDGDENRFEDCLIWGHQDTLFLAPLPPKEIEKDGFLGPHQFTPRTPRTTYFTNCTIVGGIDFIFGGGTAYFDDCVFVSNEPGYVFAPSTPEGVETGFVCRNCRFVNGMKALTLAGGEDGMDAEDCGSVGGDAASEMDAGQNVTGARDAAGSDEVPNGGIGSCYIARPWREYAAVTLENCDLDDHIADAGWHDWRKEYAHATVRFTEIGSTGPGANPASRPDWVTVR